MKIDKADSLFSKYIRTRDKWTCQRCKKQYPENSQGLHASHFYGRANENTRFDPDNVCAICFGCHQYFDEKNREDYRDFKLKQLGKKRFDDLKIRANLYCKKDRKLVYLYVKELWKTLTDTKLK